MSTSTSPIPIAWLQVLCKRYQAARYSRAQLESLQEAKFRRLVAYASERSAYYRDLIAQRDLDPQTCTPEDFPVLTKSDVVRNFDRIVTVPGITRERVSEFLIQSTDPNELLDGEYHVLHTSGTSGQIGYYVFSRHEWLEGASPIVHLVRPGIRKRIAYVAATRGHFAGVSLMKTSMRDINWLFYNLLTLDANLPVDRIIDSLNRYRPKVLGGYTAMLKVLAEAKHSGTLRIRPTMVICGGEPASPADKAFLGEAFDAPVGNVYASSEHLYMGIGFPESRGLYLMEDNMIFEFETDHVCVTNLFNYTLPLIRYRMDDMLIPDLDTSGRFPFIMTKEIVGRYEDALAFRNSFGERDFIHPLMIVELCVKGLTGWQIALTDETSFCVRARFEPGMNDAAKEAARAELRRQMERLLSEKYMTNVTFDIQEVDSLSIDPRSGKFRLVVHEELAVTSR